MNVIVVFVGELIGGVVETLNDILTRFSNKVTKDPAEQGAHKALMPDRHPVRDAECADPQQRKIDHGRTRPLIDRARSDPKTMKLITAYSLYCLYEIGRIGRNYAMFYLNAFCSAHQQISPLLFLKSFSTASAFFAET